MRKKIFKTLGLLAIILVLSGCGSADSKSEDGAKPEDAKKEDAKVETQKAGGVADVCEYFPKELVESAIGKPIVKMEVPIIGSDNCYYFTKYIENYENSYSGGKKPGGPKIVVVYDTEDFAKDRAANEKNGTRYESDPSIGMDNYVMRNNVNKIWQTALALGGEKYIRIKFIDDAVTGDDLVKIAIKFAERINGTKGASASQGQPLADSAVPLPTGEDTIRTFFELINEKRISEAVSMMSEKSVPDESAQQAWGVQFSAFKSVKAIRIEKYASADWKSDWQEYEVTLETEMTPESANGPIPYYGFEGKTNIRWIVIEKNNENLWKITGIATGP